MYRELDQVLAYHCGPALAGVKAANLVSLSLEEFPELRETAAKYNRLFQVRETGAAPGVSGGAACTAAQGAAGGRAAAEGWISRGSGRGTPAGAAEYTAADGEGISPRDRAVSGLSAGRCAGLPALPGAKLQAVLILEGLFRCGPGAGAFPAL